MDPTALADRWRETAADLRAYGAAGHAEAMERCALDLLAWWREGQDRELTTEEAEEASGYTRSALEQMRRGGKLTAAGRPNAPRYIAAELPRKARRQPRIRLETGEPDLASEILLGRERAI